MGSTKDQITPKKEKTKDFFDGVKNLIRPKSSADAKESAKSYVDLLVEIEKINSELIITKSRDVEKEKDRYAYNKPMLVELQIQQTLLQQVIESVVRCQELADKH